MQIKIAVLKIEWESKLTWWVCVSLCGHMLKCEVEEEVDRQKESMHMG